MPGRPRLALVVVLAVLVAAACGNSASPAPSGPGASAGSSAGGSGQPTAGGSDASLGPMPTDDSSTTVAGTPDLALEATLPASYQGALYLKQSLHLSDFASAGDDTTAFDATVKALGIDEATVTLAFSGDPTGGNDIQFEAYRFPGADPAALYRALVATAKAAGSNVTELKLAGKSVVKTANPSSPDETSYLYVKGDIEFGVVALTDASAATALAVLP